MTVQETSVTCAPVERSSAPPLKPPALAAMVQSVSVPVPPRKSTPPPAPPAVLPKTAQRVMVRLPPMSKLMPPAVLRMPPPPLLAALSATMQSVSDSAPWLKMAPPSAAAPPVRVRPLRATAPKSTSRTLWAPPPLTASRSAPGPTMASVLPAALTLSSPCVSVIVRGAPPNTVGSKVMVLLRSADAPAAAKAERSVPGEPSSAVLETVNVAARAGALRRMRAGAPSRARSGSRTAARRSARREECMREFLSGPRGARGRREAVPI